MTNNYFIVATLSQHYLYDEAELNAMRVQVSKKPMHYLKVEEVQGQIGILYDCRVMVKSATWDGTCKVRSSGIKASI